MKIYKLFFFILAPLVFSQKSDAMEIETFDQYIHLVSSYQIINEIPEEEEQGILEDWCQSLLVDQTQTDAVDAIVLQNSDRSEQKALCCPHCSQLFVDIILHIQQKHISLTDDLQHAVCNFDTCEIQKGRRLNRKNLVEHLKTHASNLAAQMSRKKLDNEGFVL